MTAAAITPGIYARRLALTPAIVRGVEAFTFETEITVRFAETDAQGVAHNAAYLVWFEVARIDFLARYAQGYKHIQELGYEAVTTETHARYLQPVHFDDRIVISARCVDLRGARFSFEYELTRNGELVADGWTRHALLDRTTMRPTRLPDWLVDAIA
jgi:acyl-CoA thioester hydrolase